MRIWQQPLRGPQAWTRADLAASDAWQPELTAADRREIAAALAHATAAQVPMLHWRQADFPLRELGGRLAAISDQVRDGLGITLLRGLDIADYTDEQVCMIYWGLGLYLGEPLGQNPKGDLLGHVFDQGREYGQLDVRGYETSAYLPYHTDSANMVGLMCLRQGLSGGRSSFVSAVSIYNAILAEHPEYLELLYRGFYYIRREEALTGNGVSNTPLPVFGVRDGVLSCRYIRNQINAGAVKRGIPLTDVERAALDFFDAQTQREDLRVDFMLQPGEMAFCNNLTMLHSRTGFVDGTERHQRRHMLRLWLRFSAPWPVTEDFGEQRNFELLGRTVVSLET
ncbi:TauD/TfdA family dioxygenase [Verticiella sediminum]|uniref:TauD/TfdA family dioxygenase n=1 Tax=Verticiella sediminum TaxID=1247510 RepID=A0A556AKF9_9BURK|nr:TauD/TfdA family dioxygenase [Verticiella sediminum]TSH93384.1 TauD/TfdA family dioxygenase [Verticiella sediminum]